MRSLAPAATRSTVHASVPPADLDPAAWSDLAAEIAAATDRDAVADAVLGIAAALGTEVDVDADIVVLQRTFGSLHRQAVGA